MTTRKQSLLLLLMLGFALPGVAAERAVDPGKTSPSVQVREEIVSCRFPRSR